MLYMDRDGGDSLYAGNEWGQVWIFPLVLFGADGVIDRNEA